MLFFLFAGVALILFIYGVCQLWLTKGSVTCREMREIQKRAAQYLALGDRWRAKQELQTAMRRAELPVEASVLFAQVLRSGGEWNEALLLLNHALSRFPKHAGLQKERAIVLLRSGDPASALKAFETGDPVIREAASIDMVSLLLQTGKIQEAWRIVSRELTQAPHNPLIWSLAGDCQAYLRKYERAIEFYQRALSIDSEQLFVLARLGSAWKRLGKYDKAEEILQKAWKLSPRDVGVALQLGGCLEVQEKYEQAIAVYQHVAIWSQEDPRILCQTGFCALKLGLVGHAEAYFSRAVEAGHATPHLIGLLGSCLERRKKWTEVEKLYRSLVETFPEDPLGYKLLAWMYGVGLSVTLTAEEALKCAYKAVALKPDEVAWELLSACEARAGNFDEAHTIQARLSEASGDAAKKLKHRRAMRVLRQKIPLNEQLVSRALVA